LYSINVAPSYKLLIKVFFGHATSVEVAMSFLKLLRVEKDYEWQPYNIGLTVFKS